MSKSSMNLQDSFLNQVRRENAEVKILLINGTVLRGIVKGFDNFTVILNNRNGQHLIYKHAIAQLVSHRAGGFTGKRDGEDAGTSDVPDELSLDGSTADDSSLDGAITETEPPAANRSENTSGRNSGQSGDRKKRREEPAGKSQRQGGFNTLDLSSVKLGSEGDNNGG